MGNITPIAQGSISVPYGDWEGRWFEHSVCHSCRLQLYLSQEGVQKTFPDPGYLWLSPI